VRLKGGAAAALWMGGAIASFSLLAVAVREVSPALDAFEIMLFRSAMGLAAMVAFLAATGRMAAARPRRMGLHGARNLLHFGGQVTWLYALTVLPLAQVFALEFTSPIWVILLAPLVAGERLTAAKLLGGLVGFAGVLVVVRPDASGLLSPGLAAGLACALFFALTSLLTRRITRTEPVVAVLFWLNFMQLGFSAATVGWDGAWPWPEAAQLPWLLVIGATGLSAHLCLTSALDAAPASVVMPMDFLRLPVIALVGWALYAEPLDAGVFLGAALILGGNAMTLRPRSAQSGRP
jgi:drug/metabolite transporter (DMT)-like permease